MWKRLLRTIENWKKAETRALKKIKLSKSSSTVQSDNVPDQGYSFFMPSDGPRPGTSFQSPVETSWGRGRGTFPICGEIQLAATDNLKDSSYRTTQVRYLVSGER